jgi:hypothetical protein
MLRLVYRLREGDAVKLHFLPDEDLTVWIVSGIIKSESNAQWLLTLAMGRSRGILPAWPDDRLEIVPRLQPIAAPVHPGEGRMPEAEAVPEGPAH